MGGAEVSLPSTYLAARKGNIESELKKEAIEEVEKSQKEAELQAAALSEKVEPMTADELAEVLSLTIKSDKENKVVAFLCMLSAYTENDQINVSFNSPSASGKSYIPLETAKLFPKDKDVKEISYCSPTAFFHDYADYDEETKLYVVDLERKILIFLDQPHTLLLQHLRPLLSHDKKELLVKIADRGKKQLTTKNILLRGFPSVIFCSASSRIDEQEATRFLLLSPEVNQEKLRQSVAERIKRECDRNAYDIEVETDPKRQLLKRRIELIKASHTTEITIPNKEAKTEMILGLYKSLKPRHNRDVSRLMILAKMFALLNFQQRRTDKPDTLEVKDEDFENALAIWNKINESQELGLSPYLLNMFKEVLLPLWEENKIGYGISKTQMAKKHYEVYGRLISNWKLEKEIIPAWDTAGLISKETNPEDRREVLIKPVLT